MTKHKKTMWQFSGEGIWYYTLLDACDLLDKSRSTLMRLLPRWEGVTGYTPRKDFSGRWLIPADSVHKLSKNPELYLKLANQATKWKHSVDELRARVTELEAEVSKLRELLDNAYHSLSAQDCP